MALPDTATLSMIQFDLLPFMENDTDIVVIGLLSFLLPAYPSAVSQHIHCAPSV